MASTNRVLDVLGTDRTVVDGDLDMPLAGVKGSIEFDHVDFSYGRGVPVAQDLSFTIPSGDTIAFVGATGAGKTTLVKLLLRFYDVTGGAIRVDGRDVRDLKLADLRRSIALVSQDVFLFDGTVGENIAYGRPDATTDQIVGAAQVAEVHDFIAGLPDGYETVVGERGQKLSGGQRQRISIARAILSDAPILLLDEATSAVDNETEAAIQRSLMRLAHNRTTIVIAHRLSTIRHADRIFVLSNGRIVEQGTHDELVEIGGVYRALWDVQTGELLR
jgi:ATP-binding cassette subfamily B protein